MKFPVGTAALTAAATDPARHSVVSSHSTALLLAAAPRHHSSKFFHLLASFGRLRDLSRLDRRLVVCAASCPRRHRHSAGRLRRAEVELGSADSSGHGGLGAGRISQLSGRPCRGHAVSREARSAAHLQARLRLDGEARHPRHRTACDASAADAALALSCLPRARSRCRRRSFSPSLR